MALAILPIIIISFVVIIALLGTYYVYQGYRRVRFAVPDVERTRHVENSEHSKQSPIQLHDFDPPHQQYQSSPWYGSENVIPTHVAPVAKALPRISEIEYTGGEGLISPPGRVFLSSENGKGKKREANELDKFQKQHLNAGTTWKSTKEGYGNSIVDPPELVSPKPVRTVARNHPKTEPATTAYDPAQTVAADIWDKINKGELKPSRRKAEKKQPKSLVAPTSEALRDPTDFENDLLEDNDLGSSAKEWVRARVSSAYIKKLPSKRDSSDSTITAVDANNVDIERPVSYVKRKQSIDTNTIKPSQPLDRAAEARRKMLEAKEQMADRKKREEEERQAEERRQAEEQSQRVAEQQKLSEEKKRQKGKERARSLTEVTKTEDEERCDANSSRSRRPSTGRKSDSFTESRRTRKSLEKPPTQSFKRAYTFGNDTISLTKDSVTEKKPSGGRSNTVRSMSMNDQERPDFNATMISIAEGNGTDDDEQDVDHDRTRKATNPFSDRLSRRSDGSRSSASSGYPHKYNNGRPGSSDVTENPFTSSQDAKVSFAAAQRTSGSSSIESRSQAQRRSNASSNDSRLSSDSQVSRSYSERNNSKSSAQVRASADSQSSKHSTADREKPKRKSSLASRTLGKLGRKSSSSDKKKGSDSAGLTQVWEHDGPGLRGGAMVFVAEPEEMSESDDGYEDSRRQNEETEDGMRMRGGASEKRVESGSESEAGAEKDGDSDADEDAHADNDHSEDEHSENENSESDDDTEEQDSSEDEVLEDIVSEDEHSESEVSNDEVSDAGTLDDESGGERSDDEHEQTLLQKPVKIVSTRTVGKVET